MSSDGSALARAQTAALAYLNPRPRLKVLVMNGVFAPCIIIAVGAVNAAVALVAQQGHTLFAAYAAIREVIGWVSTLTTFFWCVRARARSASRSLSEHLAVSRTATPTSPQVHAELRHRVLPRHAR